MYWLISITRLTYSQIFWVGHIALIKTVEAMTLGNRMKGTMKDAVTIIVGAGAVLDFDHKGIFPSVKNITDA